MQVENGPKCMNGEVFALQQNFQFIYLLLIVWWCVRLWASLICIQIRCASKCCWILCHKCRNLDFNLNRFLSEVFVRYIFVCRSTKMVIAFQPKTVHMVCFVSFMLHLNCLFVLVSIDFFCWSFFSLFRFGKFYSKIMHMYVTLCEFQKGWTDKIKDVHKMNSDQKATKQQQQQTTSTTK